MLSCLLIQIILLEAKLTLQRHGLTGSGAAMVTKLSNTAELARFENMQRQKSTARFGQAVFVPGDVRPNFAAKTHRSTYLAASRRATRFAIAKKMADGQSFYQKPKK